MKMAKLLLDLILMVYLGIRMTDGQGEMLLGNFCVVQGYHFVVSI